MERWVRLGFRVSAERLDAATEALTDAGLPGWQTVEGEAGEVELRVWVLPEDARATAESLASTLGPAELLDEPNRAWAQAWSPERVPPFVITLLGAPEVEVGPGEHLVRLAPALAFGGGEHPTTRACLEALPGLVHPGARVLDVGCGSGVLSVAAAQLGAATVVAVDVDPNARRATRRAAEANRVSVEVREDGLPSDPSGYDLVMANILAPTLIGLAPELRARLSPGGHLLLAGIRDARAAAVRAAYAPLRAVDRDERDGWVRLTLSGRAR